MTTVYLVQAHVGAADFRREYTHYVCRTRETAERLAMRIDANRLPVRVVEHELSDEDSKRVRFAD